MPPPPILPIPGFERLDGVAAAVSTAALGDLKSAAARARLAERLGISADQLARGRQLHRAAVVRVDAPPPGGLVAGGTDGADALWTARAGLGLVTLVADCVPVALVATRSGAEPERAVAIAVVHAGWRGAVAGIAGRAAATLSRGASVPPAWIHAAIGPHIGPCCYEVGEEVCARAAPRPGGAEAVWRSTIPDAPARLDLGALVRADLLAAGLFPARISFLPGCTACEPGRFFSYRKQRAAARFGLGLALR